MAFSFVTTFIHWNSINLFGPKQGEENLCLQTLNSA